MHRVAKFLAVPGMFLVCALALEGVSQGQAASTSNTWVSAGQMTQPRTGAAAVLLQNGEILITGGSDANGIPQTSAEFFNPTSGAFTAAPSMNLPRANHAAIVLKTGDVLVTGGVTDAGGDYTNSAEIFSAATQQWMQLQATLPQGLAGHAMAALSDGNILIAGGQSTTGPVYSLLLYNLSAQSIAPLGSLLTARTNASAAATPDGQVLIAGGTDINNNVLSSTEIFIYSPTTMTGIVSAGPAMTYARTSATATATYDGVAIIGGYNVQNGTQTDLGSAEIFSQWTNTFAVVNGGTPRSGHFAVMLPNNGAILAMGGTGGTATDLLQPWANATAGAFIAGAPSLSNQAGGFASPASLGSLLAAGGLGASANAAELYWFPTIATDQSDYAPGTTVVMTGTGFQPGETVDLHMHLWVNQTTTDLPDYTVPADVNGNISFSGYAPNNSDIGARYHLTAVGESSGFQAQTVFTDSYTKGSLTIAVSPAAGSPTANSVEAGSTSGGSDDIGACTSATGCTNGSVISTGTTIYITATAGTGYTFSKWTFSGTAGQATSTCTNNATANPCTLLAASNATSTVTANFTAASNASTSTGATSPSITYGATATSTVTVIATSGSASPTGSVAMTVSGGGSAICTALTTAPGTSETSTCTINYSANGVADSPYTLTATYTPTGAFAGSSGGGTLTVSPAGTTTTAANASATYSSSSQGVTLSATVTSTAGTVNAGTVTFTVLNGVTPVGSATTSGTVTSGNASVLYTLPAGTAAATYTIHAVYNAGGNFATSSDSTHSLTVSKATPTATLAVSNSPQTYNGSGQSATVTISTSSVGGAVANISTGGAATQTHPGTYAVTADFVPTDTTDYNTLTGLSAGNFVINKATPTATLAVSNSPQTYNGSGQSATVTISTSSVGGAVANISTGGAATQTHPGTYAVTADFVPTDTTDYNTLTGLSAGNFVINKATPTATLAVSNSPQTYNGSGQSATVTISTSSVGGAVANISTGGAATQTHPGTYAVTADFVPTDTTDYNTLTGLSAGNFVINKATPTATLAVSNSPQTYNGSGQSATVTISTSSVGGAVANISTGGAATQTHPGTYAVTADFVPTDTTDYNTLTGLSAGNFVINKATPTATLAVSNSPQTYNGSGQSATVAITVSSVPGAVANISTGGAATQIHPGTYTVTADFDPTDSTDYNTLTGLSAGNFMIQKATPTATLAVNNTPQTYNGSGQSATVAITVSSVPGAVANILTGGAATQTHPGTYAVTADFVPTDATDYNTLTALSAGNFVIQKATPTATLAVSNSPQTYNGSGQSATVGASVSSVPGAAANILTGGAATQLHPGTYAVTADFVPTDTTDYNTLTALSAGNFVIQKATPTATLAVSNSPRTYNGSGQAASVTISTSSVPGTVANISTGGAATQTHPGTYAVTADFDPTDSTDYNTLTALSAGNFVINKATPTATLAVSNSPQTYNGSGQSATVGVSVSSVPGAAANILTGGAAAQTHPGTYAVTADFVPTDSTDYNTLTGLSAGNFVIQKATPTATLAVSNSPQTYNGSGQSATVGVSVSSVPGAAANILTGGAATQTHPGTYAVTADFVPTDTTDYNTLTALSAGNFVISPAPLTITASSGSMTYGGTPFVVTPIYAGSVDGNPPSSLTTAPTCVPAFTTTTAAATYGTSCSGAADSNYSISYVGGTVTVMAAAPVLPEPVTSSSTYGTSVTLTVTVSSPDGGETPTGNVQFQFVDPADHNTYNICSHGSLQVQTPTPPATPCTVPLSSGTATVTTTNLPAGMSPDAITATYDPGDGNYFTENTSINYTVSQASTQATLNILPAATPTYGDTVTLSSVVSDTSTNSTGTPTGTVQFEYSADNTTWINIGSPVTLDGTGTAQTTTTLLPATALTGSPFIKAVYSGDSNFSGVSSGTTSYQVNPKALTVTGITASDKPYDGTTAATLNTASEMLVGVISPDVVTLTGTATGAFTDANAGTGKTVNITGLSLTGAQASDYSLTAPTTTANITQVQLTVTAPSPTVTYGDPVPATLTPMITGFVNEEGTGALTTQPTCTTTYTQGSNAGSAQTTSCSAGAATNYTFKYVNGTVTVNKATAVVVVAPYTVTYDGNPHTATVTSITGVNAEMGATVGSVTLNATHTAASTYASDSWSFTGTANYNNIASATITDTIQQANATITVNGYTGVYDGNPHGATGTAKGVNGEDLSSLLNLGSSFTNVPGGTANWSFAGNTNYNSASGTATITITQASSTTTVTCTAGPFTYNGSAQTPCTATATGVGGLTQPLTVSYSSNTNAGTASASASFAGDANHTGSNGSANFTIGQASSTTTVTCTAGPFTYNGSAQSPCTASYTTSDGLSGSLTVSYANNTNAGTASASASFAGDANHTGSNGSTNFTIGQASSTTTVTCTAGPFTYNGSAQTPCTATATGVGGLTQPLTVSYSSNTNAGTASASASFAGDANHTGSNGSANFTIGQASSTTTVTCTAGPFTYNGSAQTPCMASYTTSDGLSGLLTVSYTNNTNAGTAMASASASYAGDGNHAGSSNALSFTITPGTVLVTADSKSRLFDDVNPTLTYTYMVASNPGPGTINLSDTSPLWNCGTGTGIAGITGTPNLSTIATQTSAVGNYPITVDASSLTSSTGNCVFQPQNGTLTIYLGGIIALNGMTAGASSAVIDSYNSGNGAYSYSPATRSSLVNLLSNGAITLQGAQVYGDVLSTASSVTLQSGSLVTGNVVAGTTIGNSGTIGGTQSPNDPTSPLVATVPTACQSFPANPGSGNNWITGVYKYDPIKHDLTISGGSSGTLSPGQYCFHNVTVSGGSSLMVTGATVINLTGQFNGSGGSIINTTDYAKNLQLVSSYSGNNGVVLSGGTDAYLTVFAPGAQIVLSGGSPIFGALVGNTLIVSGNSAIHFDVSLPTSLW